MRNNSQLKRTPQKYAFPSLGHLDFDSADIAKKIQEQFSQLFHSQVLKVHSQPFERETYEWCSENW